MGRPFSRVAVVGLIALVATTAGLTTTGSAKAATTNTRAVAGASTTAAPDAGRQCGWHPANDAGLNGVINQPPDPTIYYYSYQGPDYRCAYAQGWPPVQGDYVIVHCGWYNPDYGFYWDYLTDVDSGITGWVPDSEVTWWGNPVGC